MRAGRARAEHGGLDCYGHVSTAFVAGTTPAVSRMRPRFRAGFPQLLRAVQVRGEQLVRAHSELRSRSCGRASSSAIATTAWTAHSTSSTAAASVARGVSRRCRRSRAPVDVVSIDYVADAAFALCESGRATGHVPPHRWSARLHDRRDRGRPAVLPAALPQVGAGRVRRADDRRRRAQGAERRQRVLPVLLHGRRVRGRRHPRQLEPDGITPRRCATTWTGCWTSPPAAAGVSVRSPRGRVRDAGVSLRAAS